MDLSVRIERWPLANAFTISRGSKTEAVVVTVELREGGHCGRGECVPYARYGETPERVVAAIEALRPALRQGLDRRELQAAMPAGAARNALDCAFWDLDRQTNRPAASMSWRDLRRQSRLRPPTRFRSPRRTRWRMPRHRHLRGHCLKSNSVQVTATERASRRCARAAPTAELIVDANEGWSADNLAENLGACADAGVTLIEQPLPEGRDDALADIKRPIPVCADESVHDLASLAALVGKYDAVNVKLDKSGGLTEALALAAEAERRGFSIMVGCMVATSLAMAPALLVAQRAGVVDLDGPLLLAKDREQGLRYDGSLVYPPEPALWG